MALGTFSEGLLRGSSTSLEQIKAWLAGGVGADSLPTKPRLGDVDILTADRVQLGSSSSVNPIRVTDAGGTNGRRLSVEAVTATASAQIQLVPGASVLSSQITSQILLFHRTGTDYERLAFSCVNNEFVIDSTANNNGVIRNLYFQMGGYDTPVVTGQNAIVCYSDASVDLLGATYSLFAKTWGATRTRIADPQNVGSVALLLDTRTGTPSSNVADSSYVEYRRGGATKWQVGLNVDGTNNDSFDWYSGGVTRFKVLPSGNVGISTTAPTHLLSLGGNSARTLWMERHTIANTAGNILTIESGGASVGATDKAGGNLTLKSGVATGTGTSDVVLLAHPAGVTGTVDTTATEVLRVKGSGSIVVPVTITAVGTTGNQTINKVAGRVNIAAGGTSVVVTNSLVTANSIVLVIAATADATARVTSVVAGAGSFTINTVAVTAETAFNFLVIS